MSTFDAQQFLETTVEAPMETEYQPVPEGEYNGVILHDENHPLAVRTFTNEESGRTSHVLDVNVQLDAPDVELADGKIVRYSAWLDITPEGAFERGTNKNIKLGQLREALGQNIPGQPWGIKMMAGQPLRVHVKHSKDGKFANVDSVAKIA